MALSFLTKPLDRGLFPFSIWITMLWLIPSFLAICLVLRPSCCLVPPMSGVSVRHGLRKLWRKLFRAFTCVGCRCVDFSRYTLRLSYTAFNSSTVLREKAKVHRQHKHQVISRSAVFTSSPQRMQCLICSGCISLSIFHVPLLQNNLTTKNLFHLMHLPKAIWCCAFDKQSGKLTWHVTHITLLS